MTGIIAPAGTNVNQPLFTGSKDAIVDIRKRVVEVLDALQKAPVGLVKLTARSLPRLRAERDGSQTVKTGEMLLKAAARIFFGLSSGNQKRPVRGLEQQAFARCLLENGARTAIH